MLGLALPSQAMAQQAATSQEDGEPMPDFDAAPSSSGRVVGGVLTSERPAIGALLRLAAGGHAPEVGNCSGTLVGCRWFLTAAHCIDSKPGVTYRVFLDHAGFLPVKDTHPSGEFKGCTPANCTRGDIALVELERPAQKVRSLPITEGAPLKAGELGAIFGFGWSQGDRTDYGLKRQGPVKIEDCEAQHGNSSWLCFRFQPSVTANTCKGDSGGPLLTGGEVAGVTSWGKKQGCAKDDLAYDTRVTKYAGWLKQVAEQGLRAEACGPAPYAGETGAPVSHLVPTRPYRPDGNPNKPHKLAVQAGTSELRLALHGTGRHSSNVTDIRLEARRPGSTSADPRCEATLSKLHNFAFCSVSEPEVGDWRFVVTFNTANLGAEADFTYQLIATAFRAQP